MNPDESKMVDEIRNSDAYRRFWAKFNHGSMHASELSMTGFALCFQRLTGFDPRPPMIARYLLR